MKAVKVNEARKLLATPGDLTPERLRAAELIGEMDRIENWRAWLALDLAAAMLVVGLPGMYAKVALFLYVCVYVRSILRGSSQNRAAKLVLEQSDPSTLDPAEIKQAKVVQQVATFLVAGVMIFMVTMATLLPGMVFKVAAVLFAVFLVRHALNTVRGHRNARTVLAAASQEPWYAGHVAQRDQHRAFVGEHVQEA